VAKTLTFTQSSVPAPSSPGIGKSVNISDFLMAAVNVAEEALTEEYSQKLAEHAKKAGWPTSMVEHIGIEYDQKNHKIVYTEGLEEQIMNLEYGSTESVPMPALRTFTFGDK
jgi:hypothetical protein